MGELGRMTQFKERSRGQKPGAVSVGLFMYPVLMAADVLAYRGELVPVGDDQRQHLELMRELAERFNRLFGQTFPLPETLTPSQGARIMALDDPAQKMSKSQFRPSSNIWMLDSPDDIRSKITRAVTDSGREVKYGPDKPAISNLLDIFSIASGRTPDELETEYEGVGYARLKSDLAEALITFLEPFQKRFREFSEDAAGLDRILDNGADRAQVLSAETLRTVRERIGVRRP
jgi:tryptophanyl-tRNA synthetase